MYKIEKNVPLPYAAGRPGGGKYPWREMEIGDSFPIKTKKEALSVSAAASWYSSSRGGAFRFTVRKNGNGYRCWRIK